MSSLELRIDTSADGSMSLTQSLADAALWSNCPGRYSTAIYLHPDRLQLSVTISVTTSPNTV